MIVPLNTPTNPPTFRLAPKGTQQRSVAVIGPLAELPVMVGVPAGFTLLPLPIVPPEPSRPPTVSIGKPPAGVTASVMVMAPLEELLMIVLFEGAFPTSPPIAFQYAV